MQQYFQKSLYLVILYLSFHLGTSDPVPHLSNVTCPILHPTNVEISCYRQKIEVPCDDTYTAGTLVRTRCKALHRGEKKVYNRELICQEDGQWDNELYKCVPDCGFLNTGQQTFVFSGMVPKYGDLPWHVAIYNVSDHTLICGGTLISQNVVLSAANCFYDHTQGTALNSTSDYEIIVSKFTTYYNRTDNDSQKRFQVKEIIFPNKGYNPVQTGHRGSDIVAIVLMKPVTISKFVLPACIPWDARQGFNPRENTFGKLASWGIGRKRNNSSADDSLTTIDVPYIGYQKCNQNVIDITRDKFCTMSDADTGIGKEDNGGGLVFRDSNNGGRYTLRGIISVSSRPASKTTSELSVTTFTDISYYKEWINKICMETKTLIL